MGTSPFIETGTILDWELIMRLALAQNGRFDNLRQIFSPTPKGI
jgi:hypothetical protein